MLCFIVYAAFSWIQIKKIAKHDGVLFPFCQLRRDIMKFLYENVVETPGVLSRDEYASVRRLSNALDTKIRDYNRHKTVMFNMRKMAKHLEAYRLTATPALEISDNPTIRQFHARFGRLLVKAFIAYTPLFRSERALRLIAHAYRAGKKEGARRRAAQYVISNAEKVRNDARRYGLIGDGAAA